MPLKAIFRILKFWQLRMLNDETSEHDIKQRFNQKMVVSFFEYIVLGHYENDSFNGYEVLHFIDRAFGVLLSAGSIYSTLYSMERRGLLTSYRQGRKNVFKVTEKGKLTFKVITSKVNMQAFMTKILAHP
jgi:DNA-binding PadR family transcriptional regulator